jgi:hypothetical protein
LNFFELPYPAISSQCCESLRIGKFQQTIEGRYRLD